MTLEELIKQQPELAAPAMRARMNNRVFRCTFCAHFSRCSWNIKATGYYTKWSNQRDLPVCKDWK